MKTMISRLPRRLHFYCRTLIGVFCLFPVLCQAQNIYHVRMDTSSLKGRGAFVLEFQLLDGSGLYGNGNATAEITNFTLNGGTLGTVLPSFGNVTGNLLDTLTLIDSSQNDGLADFAREFTVTSTSSEIHFDLRLHSTSVDSPVPDTFALLILDSVLSVLPTTGSYGVEMVSTDFMTTNPVPVGYMTLEAPLLVAEVTQATVGLSSVTLNTFSTYGTFSATGTVKLNTPAPAGGTVVTLTSSRTTVASVPASVTVPANAKSATFPVQTSGVAVDTDVTFTARVGSVNRTVTLHIEPLFDSFTVSAGGACGVQSLVGTVTLRHAVPTQATVVQLNSAYPTVSLPATVSVPANQLSATFPITTANPEVPIELMLSATAAGRTLTTPFRVTPDSMYTFTDLGILDGPNSAAMGINEIGQIVGYAETAYGEKRLFLYRNGVMTGLGTLGGPNSVGYALNVGGQIVGDSDTPQGDAHAFLYAFNTMADLGTLDGQPSYGRAINLFGHTAGYALSGNNFNTRAYLHLGDTMRDLGTLGGADSRAFGLTDSGMVVGDASTANGDTHAFLYSNNTMTDLGTLGGQNSTATAVSGSGLVAGSSETAGGDTRAFLYRGGTLTDLGAPGGQNSVAHSLNRYGQVVGTGQTVYGEEVAFLTSEGVMHNLNERVVNLQYWFLTNAMGINERGQIVGQAYNGTDSHAYLLTPVPPVQPLRIVSGVVNLEDCVYCSQSVTFTFRTPQGQPRFHQTHTLAPDGSFTLRGIPPGNYQLAVRGDKWLQRVVTVNTTNGNVTNLAILLLGADANGDNIVDVLDLAALIASFDADPSYPNWNGGIADFNSNGLVDVDDLDLLIRNFDQVGDD